VFGVFFILGHVQRPNYAVCISPRIEMLFDLLLRYLTMRFRVVTFLCISLQSSKDDTLLARDYLTFSDHRKNYWNYSILTQSNCTASVLVCLELSNQACNCITSGFRISLKKRKSFFGQTSNQQQNNSIFTISRIIHMERLNLYIYMYAFCLFPRLSNESINENIWKKMK
jgi:hypothetical protein